MLGAIALAVALGVAPPAEAVDIGQIKVSKGQVAIERNGQSHPGTVGMRLQTSDIVKTGADGSIGIGMSDNSLLSLGPNSVLSLDRYEFDSTTHQGAFDASLRTGRSRWYRDESPSTRRMPMTLRTRSPCLACAVPSSQSVPTHDAARVIR